MVALEHPGHRAIGKRAEDRSRLHGQAPQAEEFREPAGRRQVADDRASRGLRRAHAQAGQVRRDPEHPHALGDVGERDHHDPADQHEQHRADVADRVLQVAESECADRRGDVDDEDQHDRLLGRELHRFLGVDRGERDHGHDAGLVEEDADEEPAQVVILARVPQRVQDARPRIVGLRLRDRALAQEQERRRRGEREHHGGDQHRDRDEIRSAPSLVLRPGDIRERDAERDQPAEIAERPTPAGHAAHRLRLRKLGQERGDQVLADREEEVRQHDEHDREGDGAGRSEVQRRGEKDAAGGGDEEQFLLRGMRVGPRADERRAEEHREIRDRERRRPRERGPRSLLRDGRDEVRIEDRGDHHGRVPGVGEVVHAPCPDFAQRNVRRERSRSPFAHASFYL